MTKIKMILIFLILCLLISPAISFAEPQGYRIIVDFKYDRINKENDIYVVEKGKKSGVVNSKGNFIVKPQSNPILYYRNGLARIYKNGKYGFIDTSGKMVLNAVWDYAFDFWEGLADVRSNYKFGFVDRNGKVVIKPRWDYVDAFTHGVACVMMTAIPGNAKVPIGELIFYKGMSLYGKWGLIDRTGKVLIEPKWDHISPFEGNEGIFIITSWHKGNIYKYGVADNTGKFIIQPVLDEVTYFRDGMNLSPVKKDGKWGFIDRSGKVVTDFEWDEEPTPLTDTGKYWEVVKKSTEPYKSYEEFHGVVDDSGKLVVEPKWRRSFWFKDGVTQIVSIVEYHGREYNEYGFMDDAGNIIEEPQWDEATNFSDGIAWVLGAIETEESMEDPSVYEKHRYCWRPIDKTGEYLSLTGWDKVTDFRDGYAAVTNEDGKSTIIDKQMNPTCQLNYNVIGCLSDNAFLFEKSGLYGIVDKAGKIICKPEWEKYEFMDSVKLKLILTKDSWSKGYQYSLFGESGKLLCNTLWDGYEAVWDAQAWAFLPNLLLVGQHGKTALIDLTTETVIVPPEFEDLKYICTEKGESFWEAKKNGNIGIIAVKNPKG